MEGYYSVYFGQQQCGKVQVQRQGLYYRFVCRCQITGDVICRLQLVMQDKSVNIGVVVPMEDGFGLTTRIPVKQFPSDPVRFALIPRHSESEGLFAPIKPEEPFAYLERLKDAYLTKKNGLVGAAWGIESRR